MSKNDHFGPKSVTFPLHNGPAKIKNRNLTLPPPQRASPLTLTRKQWPKRPSSGRERSKTVKTSENEQKWPFFPRDRYFLGATVQPEISNFANGPLKHLEGTHLQLWSETRGQIGPGTTHIHSLTVFFGKTVKTSKNELKWPFFRVWKFCTVAPKWR